MGRVLALASGLVTALLGCEGPNGAPASGLETVVVDEAPQTLIATADGVIGQITDLATSPDGTVYLVDQQAHQVHIVDPSGEYRTSLGGRGEGPGELSDPTTLRLAEDTVWVVDRGNGRLQGLSRTGLRLGSRLVPPGPAPFLGPRGRFVRPTWGVDSSLAVIHEESLEATVSLGSIVGEPTNRVRPAEMKEQIRRGEVPNIFLNTAEAVVDELGSIWLFVPSRGSVERYDSDGVELWSVSLSEPEAPDVFARFVEENDRSESRFPPLNYILDASAVRGELWILLGHSAYSSASIRVVTPDGTLGRRIEFPKVSAVHRFALDTERGLVYFVRGESAELIRVGVEPAA